MRGLHVLRSRGTLRFIILSLFFLVLTLFLFRGVLAGEYITGTDSTSTIYGPAMQKAYGSYYSTWDFYDSVGLLSYPSIALSIINNIMLGTLDLSASGFAKLQLLGSFWLTGMISYYVLRALVRSEKGAFFGSLVYLANGAFINQIVEGHFGFITAYPFLILIFYLFYDAYWNGISRKTLALPALLLLYGGAVAPHMVMLAALLLIMYALIDGLASLFRGGERRAYKALLTASLVFLLILPLAYVMIVLGDSSVLETTYTLEQASAGSTSFLTAISIGGAEITNTYAYYGETTGAYLLATTETLAIALFFFALLSLSVKKYRKLTVPLLIIIVFGMFMAMGTKQPLGFVFTFLFDHVPMISSFRAPSRFLLLNALAYSVMIAITIAKWREISENMSRSVRMGVHFTVEGGFWKFLNRLSVDRFPLPSRKVPTVLIAVLLISSLSGLVVLVNGDIVRGYDAPAEYADPFSYIGYIDSGGEYYKIYTLPMMTDCYQHPYQISISGYGYPKGTTLDPGTYLPTTINENAMAHSASGVNYWKAVYSMINDRTFGYNETLYLLGSSAAVKYVVEQFFAPASEKNAFINMSGGTVLANYSSGAVVLLVDGYSSPLKAQSGLVVGTGGLQTMFILMGAGTFDPSSAAYTSLSYLAPESRDEVLEASDLIVIQDGSLIEAARELGLLDSYLLDLIGQTNELREDRSIQWVRNGDSALMERSVVTSGRNTLTISPGTVVEESTDLMVRAAYGPGQGVINISVNGVRLASVNLSAPFSGSQWFSVSIPANITQVDTISFLGSNNGTTEIYDAMLLSESDSARAYDELEEVLGPYSEKIGYVLTPLYLYTHNDTVGQWNGSQGNGVRSLNNTTYDIPFETLFDSDLTLSAYAYDWGELEVRVDGDEHAAEWSSGAYAFDLAGLAAGEHELTMFANGTYGLTLLPDVQLGGAAPEVTYERMSSTEYRITVRNASGPFVLKFSEGPSSYWTLTSENATSTWFRADHLANGFLVNGTGDLVLTMVFSKQAEFETFIGIYVGLLMASTALMVLAYFFEKRRRR